MAYPVEPKVQVAGVTAAVSGAVLWVLGTYVFKGTVPDGIASMIYVATPGVLAFAAAWLAPHQHRDPVPVLTVPASAGPAVSLTGEQMETVRGALGSGERKVPPAP